MKKDDRAALASIRAYVKAHAKIGVRATFPRLLVDTFYPEPMTGRIRVYDDGTSSAHTIASFSNESAARQAVRSVEEDFNAGKLSKGDRTPKLVLGRLVKT